MKKSNLFSFLCFLLASNSVFADANWSDWSKYADNLQTCTPGTYNLTDPIIYGLTKKVEVITYQIVGMNAGNCQVNITRSMTGPGATTPTTLKLNCAFSADNIPLLIKSAKDIASGTVKISSDDPVSQIIHSSCKETS